MPPHPTPPHPTPQSRYSKTCVLRERFSVRRHKQECMGYLSVCPLLDTGIPPCTFHPEIRWCHCPLFRSESVCQRTSTMSESHGKPWKKALVTLQRGGLWHRVCQSSVVFFFCFQVDHWPCPVLLIVRYIFWFMARAVGRGSWATYGILRHPSIKGDMWNCETMFAEWLQQCLNTVSRMILNGQQLGYIMYNVNPGLINHGL